MSPFYISIRTPLFFLQTMAAVIMFGWYLPRRSHPALRTALLTTGGALLSAWYAAWLYFPGRDSLPYVLPRTLCMMFIYATLIAATYLLFDTSWASALFTASAGYAAQNMAGSLKTLMRLIPTGPEFVNTTAYNFCLDTICYGSMYLVLFLLLHERMKYDRAEFDNQIKAVFCLIVMLFCIGTSRLTQVDIQRTGISIFSVELYSLICSLLLLQVQFGALENKDLNRDMHTMRELVHQQKSQYENSKESAQLISEKYHDLKQMIGTLSGKVSESQLSQLETSIEDYGIYSRTGNEVLDVVLTEKRMLCRKQNIKITCIAGGVDLHFMEELDRYSLFSNALTNAIEAVNKLPEEGERNITLTITQKMNLVFIHLENPCPGIIEFQDGLPLSKRDSRYHGFGMKSMERTVKKYHGTIAASQLDGMFFLDIVLEKPS